MSTIQVNAIQSSSGTQEVSQTTLFSGTAKAWFNLDGTGTIAERNSFNISGYVDNGTGNYTGNLSNSWSGADNCSMSSQVNYGNGNAITASTTTSNLVYNSYNDTPVLADAATCQVGAMGDLA